MTHDPADCLVTVTGASGFIAMHCVLRLLREGYRVRGTLRSAARGASIRATLEKHVDIADRLEFAIADLTRDDGWADAMAGARYLLHVASPLPRKPPKHENELIEPARGGALRALEAAHVQGVEGVGDDLVGGGSGLRSRPGDHAGVRRE
ncbi:MAG: NAD-dependent epimerase/dehydratase family protein [Proteobacteria bacterium]|nr:NAD-dependent epimerase/dehydratase family protein [Pseudomonadota bacterium]